MSSVELTHGVGEILIDEDALRNRIRELGEEISADYVGRDLLLIGVLKGAVFFMADLMRRLTVACEVDFMAISSYGASTDSSGVVRILKDLDINIEGRDVLVVEDIIDSGLTLSYLIRNLEAQGAGEPRGVRPPDQAGPPRDRRAGALRRLRDPEPLRDRLRTRLRRAVPKSAVRRRSPPRSDPRGRLGPPVRATAAQDSAATLRTRNPVSRFFRSALFPLIVIAAIVWLATQTLVTTGKKSRRRRRSRP